MPAEAPITNMQKADQATENYGWLKPFPAFEKIRKAWGKGQYMMLTCGIIQPYRFENV